MEAALSEDGDHRLNTDQRAETSVNSGVPLGAPLFVFLTGWSLGPKNMA